MDPGTAREVDDFVVGIGRDTVRHGRERGVNTLFPVYTEIARHPSIVLDSGEWRWEENGEERRGEERR